MIQADTRLSTPPTNTSVHPSSRRRFLAQAAAVAAGSGTLGMALPLPGSAGAAERVPDPVLDLIEAHRRADEAHRKALKVQDRFERRYGVGNRSGGISEKACNDEDDAFEALVAGVATTLPGLLAWLAYLQKLDSEFETEWMITDRLFAPTLIKSFAASLGNIGVQA
jgi:hypothetical protein